MSLSDTSPTTNVQWNPTSAPRCHGDVTRIVEPTAAADASDFQALYERELVRAVKLAHLLTGSNEAAEDIAQETFLRIRDRLGRIDHPHSYITATVVNLCRNWHRGRSRRVARELQAAAAEIEPTQHDEILDVVDRLPFRQRTVLVARYWLDLSETEIAGLLGCRPGTVKSLASRGLDALRKELA
jgi:RNA polymerase sigma factor (sigma-70 family)